MSVIHPYLFIVNPNSGEASSRTPLSLPEHIETKMRSLGQVCQVIVTEYPGHATEIARTAVKNSNWKAIVSVGGDGTINEVARSMLFSQVPLGILPAGSGNGLARHLNIPMNLDSALHRLVEGTPLTIDAGRLNDHVFFCTAGIGFDAAVSHAFAHSKERGFKNYVKYCLDVYRDFDAFPVKINNEETSLFMLTFANAGQFGNNAWIAPQARISDGKLDLCEVPPFPDWYSMIFGAKLFTKALKNSQYLKYTQFSESFVETTGPQPAHIDGEAITLNSDKLHVTCIPQCLRVIC